MSTQDFKQQNTLNNDSNDALAPAISIPLSGRHLIEASAGTGKTWTLTGVVLRLLVEAGYPCDKIIATTFTRSAAAEMRQRIRQRLQNFAKLLTIITRQDLTPIITGADTPAQATQQLITWLEAVAGRRGLDEEIEDLVNRYLIESIANQVFSHLPQYRDNTITDDSLLPLDNAQDSNNAKKISTKPTLDFRVALQRTMTALNQLDRLFVSTLDSLCQKWLREFSSETGFSADIQISNDVKSIVMGMIHDQLRAFWAQLMMSEPEIYQLMHANKKLMQAEDFYPTVERALNFYTADIDTLPVSAIDLTHVKGLIKRIVNYDMTQLSAYFDTDYRKAQKFAANGTLFKKFSLLPDLQQDLQHADINDLMIMDDDNKALMKAINEFVETGKGFNTKSEKEQAQLKSFPVIEDISELAKHLEAINEHISHINLYFAQFISRYVRDNLPQVLEAQRLTTFSLHLARLNQALKGRQGESLARYIRHQYPVALIDESQDINTEQALSHEL